ncbi:UNVERIFIED_CONTAM: hypothetical protein HDU68_006524, partial [Siphonaria sp. JEL0065]
MASPAYRIRTDPFELALDPEPVKSAVGSTLKTTVTADLRGLPQPNTHNIRPPLPYFLNESIIGPQGLPGDVENRSTPIATQPTTGRWASHQTPQNKSKIMTNPIPGIPVVKDEKGPEWFNSFADWIDCLEAEPGGRPKPMSNRTSPALHFKNPAYNYAGEAAETHYPMSSNFPPLLAQPPLSQTTAYLPSLEDCDFLSESVAGLTISRRQSLDIDVPSPAAGHSVNVGYGAGGSLRSCASNSSLSNTVSPVNPGRVSDFGLQSPTALNLPWAEVPRSWAAGGVLFDVPLPVTHSSLQHSSSFTSSDVDQFGFPLAHPATSFKSTLGLSKTSPPLSSNTSSPGFSASAAPLSVLSPSSMAAAPALHYSSAVSGSRTSRPPVAPAPFLNSATSSTNGWPTAVMSSMLSPVSPSVGLHQSSNLGGATMPSAPTPSRVATQIRPSYTRNNSGFSSSSSSNSPGGPQHHGITTTTGIIPAVFMKGIKSKEPLKP